MKAMKPLLIFVLLAFSAVLSADELSDAYQKEYAYLVSEKEAIAQRLSVLRNQHGKTLNQLRRDITVLEQGYLTQQNQVDRLNQQIIEASRTADTSASDVQLMNTTLLQATESLDSVGVTLSETMSPNERLADAFAKATAQISQDASVTFTENQYFDAQGTAVSGQVMHIGRIARYGLDDAATGPLYPSGNGMFSLWENRPANVAQQLSAGENTGSVDLFLYDNMNKAIEKRDDKTFMDDISAGGIIGKVILVLGVVGLLLVILRAIFLMTFSSNVHRLSEDVDSAMEGDKRSTLLATFERGKGSAHRVIAQTLKNLDKDRDHIEDIVSESILHERSKIDRFGPIILVLAAISPLLGLLGTVTGMITTFDIITEFGTGDPKLLSSGISEALITTKFGLIVAIPLLLLGNVLTSWGSRIKTELEQVALHVINTHKA